MTTIHIRADGPDALAQVVAQHRAGFAANFGLQAGADFADTSPSDIMPLDVSRFPDSCAFEGAAPVVSYEDGIAEAESDPWVFWAVVAGVIDGMLLSVAYPLGVAA